MTVQNQCSNTIHMIATCSCIKHPWWTCCIHVAGHLHLSFPCIGVDLIMYLRCFLTDTKKNYLMALSHCLQSLPQSVLLRELPQVSLYLSSHKDTYSIKYLTEKNWVHSHTINTQPSEHIQQNSFISLEYQKREFYLHWAIYPHS